MQVGARNSTNFSNQKKNYIKSKRKKNIMDKTTLEKLQREIEQDIKREKENREKGIYTPQKPYMKGIQLWHYLK
jgi:hypothetical protein